MGLLVASLRQTVALRFARGRKCKWIYRADNRLRDAYECSVPLYSVTNLFPYAAVLYLTNPAPVILSPAGSVDDFADTPAYKPENLVPLLDPHFARLTNHRPPTCLFT